MATKVKALKVEKLDRERFFEGLRIARAKSESDRSQTSSVSKKTADAHRDHTLEKLVVTH